MNARSHRCTSLHSAVFVVILVAGSTVVADARATDGMMYVPAGTTQIGTTDDQRRALVRQYGINPQVLSLQTFRMVDVPEFWIDRFEVTNRQYRDFVRATDHRQPIHWLAHGYPKQRGDYPVTGVDYEDAVAYAQWAGKRLPREVEWEKAARGADGRLWPWGNQWDPTACRWGDSGDKPLTATAAPVGSYPRDRSVFDVMDMAGNLAEWVEAPLPKPVQYTAIVKGGSFVNSAPWQFLCATRNAHPKGHGGLGYLGFRCALDAPAPENIAPLDNRPRRDWKPKSVRAPQPNVIGKLPIQFLPIRNHDPQRARYQNTMGSTFLTLTSQRALAIQETTPWRIEVRVPYLPDDRFTLFFENHWFRTMQAIEFNDDFTRAVLRSRWEDHLDASIVLSAGSDFVDVQYELENLRSAPLDPAVEMCFQSMGAPNFRDHDGTRTFIQTETGFHSTARLNRTVNQRLWCQDYTLNPATGTSSIAPEKQRSLIAIVSRDRQWVVAPTALSGPAVRLFNNWEYSCLHCTPPSRLEAKERRVFKQRVYFLRGNLRNLVTRFEADYKAEHSGNKTP